MKGEWEITEEEKTLIIQLRDRAKDELTIFELSKSKEDQDLFLVRWIRARENKLDKATDMLLKSLKWRKENQVDDILSVKLDPFFPNNYTSAYPGVDKFHHPIVLLRPYEWDLRTFGNDEASLKEFDKFLRFFFERITNAIWKEHVNRKPGELPVTQFTLISNFAGYPYSQLANIKAVKKILQFMSMYEAHYPEVLFKAIFLNCPSYFSLFLNIVKQVLPAKTTNKFVVYSSAAQWQKEMEGLVDPAILPEEFGGPGEAQL